MSSAIISPCGLYRYRLTRTWDPELIEAAWVMLNPSTADASVDDPTIRRCIAFSKRLGFGGLIVVNLFALRYPNPQDLIDSAEAGIDPVGPENDEHIRDVCDRCARVFVAWGAHPIARERVHRFSLLAHRTVYCLGTTKDGSPKHPLYVRADAEPVEYLLPQKGRE